MNRSIGLRTQPSPLTAGGSARARTPLEWSFYALGLLATVAVTVYLTRVARAGLARRAAA